MATLNESSSEHSKYLVNTFPEIYRSETLHKKGISDLSKLASFVTADEVVVYPAAQFKKNDDGSLSPYPEVIELWSKYFVPAIERRDIPATTACKLLFGAEDSYFQQLQIAKSEDDRQKVYMNIELLLYRFSS